MPSAALAEGEERLVLAAERASPTVRLVGGSGLALLLGHRRSDDLNLFAGVREELEPIVRAVEEEALRLGRAATRVRTGPGFVRLEVPDAANVLRVDIASDTAPRLVTSDTVVGAVRVEALVDQRANKMVALLGRSELRDLVDLYFIERAGLPVAEGFADALSKDGGMDPGWFAWALEQVKIAVLPGLLEPLDLNEVRAFRERIEREALDIAGANR